MFLKNIFIHSPSSLIFKDFKGWRLILFLLVLTEIPYWCANRSVLFCPFPLWFCWRRFIYGEMKFPIYNSNVVVVENILLSIKSNCKYINVLLLKQKGQIIICRTFVFFCLIYISWENLKVSKITIQRDWWVCFCSYSQISSRKKNCILKIKNWFLECSHRNFFLPKYKSLPQRLTLKVSFIYLTLEISCCENVF